MPDLLDWLNTSCVLGSQVRFALEHGHSIGQDPKSPNPRESGDFFHLHVLVRAGTEEPAAAIGHAREYGYERINIPNNFNIVTYHVPGGENITKYMPTPPHPKKEGSGGPKEQTGLDDWGVPALGILSSGAPPNPGGTMADFLGHPQGPFDYAGAEGFQVNFSILGPRETPEKGERVKTIRLKDGRILRIAYGDLSVVKLRPVCWPTLVVTDLKTGAQTRTPFTGPNDPNLKSFQQDPGFEVTFEP